MLSINQKASPWCFSVISILQGLNGVTYLKCKADTSNKQVNFRVCFMFRGSILNLIFANESELVENVKVGPPLSSTCDHNVVSFDLGLRTLGDESQAVKLRLWSKADIVSIGLSLECKNWPLFFQNCRSVDDMWVSFLSLIHI